MSRLSLKPGGEPGRWIVQIVGVDGTWWDREITCYPVPDEDLMDIRSTLSEYLDAKYEVVDPMKPKESHPIWLKYALCGLLAMLALCFAAVGFMYGWSRVPTISPSTGGVIDQLCMRPDIECSTSIRYVHPQAGVPHQERETYSADSLSQAHLEEQ